MRMKSLFFSFKLISAAAVLVFVSSTTAHADGLSIRSGFGNCFTYHYGPWISRGVVYSNSKTECRPTSYNQSREDVVYIDSQHIIKAQPQGWTAPRAIGWTRSRVNNNIVSHTSKVKCKGTNRTLMYGATKLHYRNREGGTHTFSRFAGSPSFARWLNCGI